MTTEGFVFIDLETTGLKPTECEVLEIGMALYSFDYKLLDSYESLVVSRNTRVLLESDKFDPFIKKMHGSELDGGSDLIADLNIMKQHWHAFMPSVVEKLFIEKARDWGVTKATPVCGSSVAFDRGFMAQHMPKLNETFSYRNIDVSSDMEKMKSKYPHLWAKIEPRYEALKKENASSAHRVLDDIKGSARIAKMIDNEIWDAAAMYHEGRM